MAKNLCIFIFFSSTKINASIQKIRPRIPVSLKSEYNINPPILEKVKLNE